LRGIFDEDGALYDRIRLGYLATLLDLLAELAGIGPGCPADRSDLPDPRRPD